MENSIDFIEEGDKLINLFKELEEAIKNECKKNGIFTDEKNIGYLIKVLSEKNSVVKKYIPILKLILD